MGTWAFAIMVAIIAMLVIIGVALWLHRRLNTKINKMFEDSKAPYICFLCHEECLMCKIAHEPESVGECAVCGRIEPCSRCSALHYPPKEESYEEEASGHGGSEGETV